MERDLAIRQLAVKDFSSRSWFIKIQETLFQYELPSAHDLIENPPEKISMEMSSEIADKKVLGKIYC